MGNSSKIGILKKQKALLKKKFPILTPDWNAMPVPIKELDLIAFMQECRERTADMKDEEKCKYCKLRFRCYTEIKVNKKGKRRTLETLEGLQNELAKDTKSSSRIWM